MNKKMQEYMDVVSKMISGAIDNKMLFEPLSDDDNDALLKEYWKRFEEYPKDIKEQVLYAIANTPFHYDEKTVFEVGHYIYISAEWDPIIAENTYKPMKKVQIVGILSKDNFLVREGYAREYTVTRDEILF